MKTDDLIGALSADATLRGPRLVEVWSVALLAAAAIAAAVFLVTIGPREDIAIAATTGRFLFKFVVTIALTAAALFILDRIARPGAGTRWQWLALLVPPALLAGAIGVELSIQPPEQWSMLTTGKNSLVCLTYIPLIGLGPLAVFIAALRRGAPTRPILAGVIAGLVAGGVAATFYAAHCTDDSPLFVATWYTLAIAMLGVLGGILGRIFARW
jgi:hypothetical protein